MQEFRVPFYHIAVNFSSDYHTIVLYHITITIILYITIKSYYYYYYIIINTTIILWLVHLQFVQTAFFFLVGDVELAECCASVSQ